MYIYSTYDYDGSHEMSRSLLARAFDHCMMDVAASEKSSLGLSGCELVERIETSEHGKPFVPGWLAFSVSHTENAWAVLIADNPCGLDIQFPRECNMEKIADRFYTDEERALVADEGEDAFWQIWTRREAAVKAVGATVVSNIPDVTDMSVEIEDKRFWLHEFELLGADIAPYGAICTEDEPLTVHYFRL